MVPDRRADDDRLKRIEDKIDKLAESVGIVCIKVAVVERANDATQKELIDHKDAHRAANQEAQEAKNDKFRLWDIVVGVGMLVLAALQFKIGGAK